MTELYDEDFFAWTIQNASLLKQGKLAEVDIHNIAEELESMGKRDKRQLINRLIILIAHLLKWENQPDKRSNGWRSTIKEQRRRVLNLLADSPSLKHEIEKQLNKIYESAITISADETLIDESDFPKHCPYTATQILDDNFYPDYDRLN